MESLYTFLLKKCESECSTFFQPKRLFTKKKCGDTCRAADFLPIKEMYFYLAAFAAAVKIDSFAYMPVQDFGNAFSTFIAQNYGAGKEKRISQGIKSAVTAAFVFCLVISAAVCAFAAPLMGIFVNASQTEIISIGVGYLRIEGAFYFGIGLLFLLYGYYRAVKMPGMSVILTILSLGTRVVLAYTLSAVPESASPESGHPFPLDGHWQTLWASPITGKRCEENQSLVNVPHILQITFFISHNRRTLCLQIRNVL